MTSAVRRMISARSGFDAHSRSTRDQCDAGSILSKVEPRSTSKVLCRDLDAIDLQ